MINLIPPAARAKIVKEYWFRVIAVWMFLLGTGCLIVASLLLPTYMLLRSELTTLRNQVMDNEVKVASFSTSAAELTKAMEQTRVLLTGGVMTPATTFDRALSELAGTAVQINATQFNFSTSSVTIMITGVANTRTDLATFRDVVEGSPLFSNAVLPISSLIKDRDLDFTMTITGTTSAPTL